MPATIGSARWLDETIGLDRVYATIWKDAAPAHLVDIAVLRQRRHAHRQRQLFRVCAAGTAVKQPGRRIVRCVLPTFVTRADRSRALDAGDRDLAGGVAHAQALWRAIALGKRGSR